MDIKINKDYPQVNIDGESFILTKKEFDVFSFLWDNKGRICTRDLIHTTVWGSNNFNSNRVIDEVIVRIRKKLPLGDKLITRKGFGYSLIV